MKNCALIVLITIVLSACGGNVAAPAALPAQTAVPNYNLLGTQGNMRFVAVDKGLAGDRKMLKSIADAVCADQLICVALFWDDPSKAASSYPLTDAQVKAQIATYSLNLNTGKDSLIICSVDGC